MRPASKRLSKLVPILIGVTLVVVMLLFLNANRAAIYNELVALYLIPQPERLTELYFNDDANLPSAATNNQVISFTFVIHNLETTDYQYVYNVFVNVNDTEQIVDSGSVMVKNDHYYVKSEKFKFTNSSARQEVVVELVNKQQSIDFWLGKS